MFANRARRPLTRRNENAGVGERSSFARWQARRRRLDPSAGVVPLCDMALH